MDAIAPGTGADSRPTDRSGFTLIEVMLAMLLLSAGALGLAQMTGAAVLVSRSAGSASVISLYAENMLEAARDRGWAGNPPGIVVDTLQVRGARFARTRTVEDRNVRTREIRVEIERVGGGELSYSTVAYVIR